MKTLTARYYISDARIAIFDSQAKLTEFSVDDRGFWGLPKLEEWKKTDFGCEIEFRFVVE